MTTQSQLPVERARELARKATCDLLGYKDWFDASDYRLTGHQERQINRTLQAFLKHGDAAYALGVEDAGMRPAIAPGVERDVVGLADALRDMPDERFRQIADAKDVASTRWLVAKLMTDYSALLSTPRPADGESAIPASDEEDRLAEMAAFGASENACYLYPEANQQPERAAYCAGAADGVRSIHRHQTDIIAYTPRPTAPEDARGAAQAEGFAAAVQWLRDRSAMHPPATLHHAATILADQMERSRVASQPQAEDR